MRKYTKQPIIKRWIKKVSFSQNCWIWNGARDGKGYGHIRFGKGHIRAHKLIYILLNGDIKDKRELDHLCKNKRCVNPTHLELVSHAENIKRANIKRNKFGRYIK